MPPSRNSTSDSVPNAPDDRELLRQVQHGSETAFNTLLERHGRYLHGVARALVQNPADAEDLVQETFLAVFRGNFRGESSVRTWMVKILVRQAGMLRRSRWGLRKPAQLSESAADPAESTSATGGTEAKIDLATMLQSLSSEHRAVIVLRELEQLSYEEMADALGVPRGTVESRLHRAREELRKKFKGYL